MTTQRSSVSNLIQGVSQQAAQQRRDAQAESQFDCVNSPKDGAWARHGLEVIATYAIDLTGRFFFESIRGTDERYVLSLGDGPSVTDQVKAFKFDGTMGSVTAPAGYMYAGGYLKTYPPGLVAKDSLAVQTVDDYTFVASRGQKALMSTTATPLRPKEALIFCKAGAYKTSYTLTFLFAGTKYSYRYETPDTATAANAPYIATTQIAATFFRALANTDASLDPNNYGYYYPGDDGTHGNVYGSDNPLTSHGFSVSINGNLIRVWRNDGQDFDVDSSDGQGGAALIALKDTVRAFTDLPKGGFEGMVFRVTGVSSDGNKANDYYVAYTKKTTSSGVWAETVAPGSQYAFDANTMPHAIVNTGDGTFEVRRQIWSTRIAGDGINTARDPGFVGRYIQDLFYHQSRLAFLTEGTCDWSKARNVYTHFPDTVQTVLQDAPINITLSAAKLTVELQRAATVDESLLLWGDRAQFRVFADGSQPFKQDTIEAPHATSYEFAEQAGFATIGKILYFVTEPGNYANIRSLPFANGRPADALDVTDHVPDYIPAGVRRLIPSDTCKMVFVQTDGDPASLYLYNYLQQGDQLVQTAWNKWRFPGVVLWAYVDGNVLYALIKRNDTKTLLVSTPLRATEVDAGGAYRTRLDLRVSEAQVSALAYDPVADQTTFTMPYSVMPDTDPDFLMAIRTTDSKFQRGKALTVLSAIGTTVTVRGDITAAKFYAGFRITSERTESEFFIRTDKGVTATERLTVNRFEVLVDTTGYTRLEVIRPDGLPQTSNTFKPLKIGGGAMSLGSDPPLKRGRFQTGVSALSDEATVRIVNDTFLPSRWQSATYFYEATIRGQGKPDA